MPIAEAMLCDRDADVDEIQIFKFAVRALTDIHQVLPNCLLVKAACLSTSNRS